MSVDYKGLLNGNINPLDLARVIHQVYGGEAFNVRFGQGEFNMNSGHYVLNFDEEFSDEVKALRPWDRKNHRIHRMMHVFTEGECACDYAEITTEPMTYVSLGHWGQCKEIINALIFHFGGYRMDEAGSQEWEQVPADEAEAAGARIKARMVPA